MAQALTSAVLMERAGDALRRKLAADPRDQDALLGLGDLSRRSGEFAQALAAYRTLHELRCDAASAWLVGAMGGEQLPGAAPDGFHAAPFALRTNFLCPAEQQELRVALSAASDEFQPAGVSKRSAKSAPVVKLEQPEYRLALHAKWDRVREVQSWFVPRLRTVLPAAAAQLGVSSYDDREVEIGFTATLPGGFFRVHRDAVGDPEDPSNTLGTRAISYVYYCHREPRSFAGGELLLYDTCLATRRFRQGTFSRIDPMHNTLVLFPSCYYHEILPVRGASDRLEDARLTLNGWVHRDRDEAAVRAART